MIRTPDERFAGLPDFPYEPNYLEWEGLRLHYLDEGEGPPVVLHHGEPTWSFLYRRVIPHLTAAGFRAIAPDMPGFGRSDKPTDPAFYTYDNMTAAMGRVSEALGLEDATVVVQDWGGPIGLRTAVEHPDRFRRLVVMNTGLYTGPARVTPAFEAWHSFVEQNPDLPIAAILRSAATRDWEDSVLDAYEAPFPTAEHKVGAWRMPLIVPMADDDPGAVEMKAVLDALGTWAGPALVLFSDSDPIFPLSVAERFAALIPGAGPVEVVEGAGHFLQEEEPDAVGGAIADFLVRTS